MTLLPTADGAPAAPEAAPPVPVPAAETPLSPPVAPAADPTLPATVAELAAKLSDDDQKVRFNAVVALGKLGTGAIVRPLLHVVRSDADYFVRRMAIRALGDLGREALSAVPDIAQAVRDKEPFVRDAATQAIAKITGKALPYRKGMTEEEVAAAARKLVEEARDE
jgi:HEAT repeat protein